MRDPDAVRQALRVAKSVAADARKLRRAPGGMTPTAPALAPEDTAPQRGRFLSESKVVNPKPEPGHDERLLFHATTKDFDAFDPARSDMGIHVGSLTQAQDRLKNLGSMGEGHVIPLYVRARSLLRLEDYGNFSPANVLVQLEDQGLLTLKQSKTVIDKMRQMSQRVAAGETIPGLNLPRNEMLMAKHLLKNNQYLPTVGEHVLREHLKGMGYDGVVYLNRGEGLGTPDPEESGLPAKTDMLDIDYSDRDVETHYPEAHDSYILFDANQVKTPWSQGYDLTQQGYNKARGGEVDGDDGWTLLHALDLGHARHAVHMASGGEVEPAAKKNLPEFVRDNPGGDWLAYKKQLSDEAGALPSGAPRSFGTVTGHFPGHVYLPVSILKKIPGVMNEQYHVREKSLDSLVGYMSETGKLPMTMRGDKEHAPFVTVDQRGRPFVNEGNHRIMAAAKLGWEKLPVQISYFNGGEQASGILHPDRVIAYHQSLAKPNKASGGTVGADMLLDSTGKPVHHTPEGVENFKQWHEGSKVVDEQGRPLVVYHGTSKDTNFARFKVGPRGSWFTQDPEVASQYAKENDSQGHDYSGGRFIPKNTASRVIPAYLSIKNPYVLTEQDHQEMNRTNYAKAQRDIFTRIRAQGHDGVSMGGGVWVAFGPDQIKSAIGNSGEYSHPSNITKAEGGSVDTLLDSTGKSVHHTPEGVENFKKWHAGSKVVDEQGRPLVVYHGTDYQGTSFDPERTMFTTNREAAEDYGDRVVSCYLSVKNPLKISSRDWESGMAPSRQEALRAGYDGYIVKNHDISGAEGEDTVFSSAGDTYIPFHSHQIKSAGENSGEYSHPSNITKAEGGTVDTLLDSTGKPVHHTPEGVENFKRWFGESKAVDEQGRPVVIYRGATGDANKGIDARALNAEPRTDSRQKWAAFSSTNPHLAATYGAPHLPEETGAIVPAYIKAERLIEFPVKKSFWNGAEYTSFDKLEFDKRASRLKPGEVLVVRGVTDPGPRSEEAFSVDPEKKYSMPGDIYAWGSGTSLKSAVGNTGAYDHPTDITKADGGSVGTLLDSTGKPVHHTPEGVENFKKWHAGSKAVDEQGRPLVLYHGTIYQTGTGRVKSIGDIHSFDRLFSTKIRQHSGDTVGSWFSTNPGEGGAEMYSGAFAGSAIYPVYLSIKNPHETTFGLMNRRARLLANGKDDGRMLGKPEVDAYRQWLKDIGKDGIKIVHDEYNPSGSTEFKHQDAWIALEPEQIKSAVGNTGEYDPENKMITKKVGGTIHG